MDSLHVVSSTNRSAVVVSGSKQSSRSASPCRTRPPQQLSEPSTRGRHRTAPTTTDDGNSTSSTAPIDESMTTTTTSCTDEGGGGGEADSSLLQQSLNGGTNREGGEEPPPPPSVSDPKLSTNLEHLANKIVRVKDLIRMEQKLRDDNVNEYLKLASNADKQQVQRIKAVFEKKNQKSAQVIAQLQKKLDLYQKRVYELETYGAVQSHKPPREVLRDMGQGLKHVGGNIRDGITGLGGTVMAKPREFAHLIKNKFGSADNISQLSRSGGAGGTGSESSGTTDHGSSTLPANLNAAAVLEQQAAAAAAAAGAIGSGGRTKFPSDEGSECSSVTSDSLGRIGSSTHHENLTRSQEEIFKAVFKQLSLKQDEIDNLKEKIEHLKQLEQQVQYLSSALQEERLSIERLEEQINDLTELHQNEVENLKQAMADMEEKVQYQSEERIRDIHEILEHCQTKIQKMEHQALQQQQYVTLDGLDNSNARALVVKLINILLTVLQVVLLLVATGAGIIMPFLRTRVRILTTVFIVLAAVFILRQWPEVRDIGTHVMKRLKDTLEPSK